MQVFILLLLFLDRPLPSLGTCPTLAPVRSPPYLFSASAAEGAKQGKSQGCVWVRLPLARERAAGPGGAPGPSTPCWGRSASGKVPADLPPCPGQQTLQAAPTQGVLLPPAPCPPLGPPRCFLWGCAPAQTAAGLEPVEFSLGFFWFVFFLSLSNHCPNTTSTKMTICNLAIWLLNSICCTGYSGSDGLPV